MRINFSGSKAATYTAGGILVLVGVGIAFLVGGEDFLWTVKNFPARFAASMQSAFPLLWEYKWYLIVLGALVLVIRIVRGVAEGPVKKY